MHEPHVNCAKPASTCMYCAKCVGNGLDCTKRAGNHPHARGPHADLAGLLLMRCTCGSRACAPAHCRLGVYGLGLLWVVFEAPTQHLELTRLQKIPTQAHLCQVGSCRFAGWDQILSPLVSTLHGKVFLKS